MTTIRATDLASGKTTTIDALDFRITPDVPDTDGQPIRFLPDEPIDIEFTFPLNDGMVNYLAGVTALPMVPGIPITNAAGERIGVVTSVDESSPGLRIRGRITPDTNVPPAGEEHERAHHP